MARDLESGASYAQHVDIQESTTVWDLIMMVGLMADIKQPSRLWMRTVLPLVIRFCLIYSVVYPFAAAFWLFPLNHISQMTSKLTNVPTSITWYNTAEILLRLIPEVIAMGLIDYLNYRALKAEKKKHAEVMSLITALDAKLDKLSLDIDVKMDAKLDKLSRDIDVKMGAKLDMKMDKLPSEQLKSVDRSTFQSTAKDSPPSAIESVGRPLYMAPSGASIGNIANYSPLVSTLVLGSNRSAYVASGTFIDQTADHSDMELTPTGLRRRAKVDTRISFQP
jgi:hypothetical protein